MGKGDDKEYLKKVEFFIHADISMEPIGKVLCLGWFSNATLLLLIFVIIIIDDDDYDDDYDVGKTSQLLSHPDFNSKQF